MEAIGISTGYLVSAIFSLLILTVWIVLVVYALFALRKRSLPSTAAAIWTAMIICIPLFGALAFLIVKPENSRPE